MHTEATIRTFIWTCDNCGKQLEVKGASNSRPDGWTIAKFGPCGMTGYFMDHDHCDDCSQNNESK